MGSYSLLSVVDDLESRKKVLLLFAIFRYICISSTLSHIMYDASTAYIWSKLNANRGCIEDETVFFFTLSDAGVWRPGLSGIPGIPGSRDLRLLKIPVFLKMKSRDFALSEYIEFCS